MIGVKGRRDHSDAAEAYVRGRSGLDFLCPADGGKATLNYLTLGAHGAALRFCNAWQTALTSQEERRSVLLEKAADLDRLALLNPAGFAVLRGYCGSMRIRLGCADDYRLLKKDAEDVDRLFKAWRGLGTPAGRKAAARALLDDPGSPLKVARELAVRLAEDGNLSSLRGDGNPAGGPDSRFVADFIAADEAVRDALKLKRPSTCHRDPCGRPAPIEFGLSRVPMPGAAFGGPAKGGEGGCPHLTELPGLDRYDRLVLDARRWA
jgi:hypothetical protein